MLGMIFLADIFSANNSASSGGVGADPREFGRTPPDIHRISLLAEGPWIRAEPGGVRADPRVSARIRGGRSSAEGKAEMLILRITIIAGARSSLRSLPRRTSLTVGISSSRPGVSVCWAGSTLSSVVQVISGWAV